MNGIDVALVILLLLCAGRGLWRGFFRESFGFLGLITGLVAALRLSDEGAAWLATYVDVPAAARLGIAFVGIFILVHTVMNLFGFILDRLLGGVLLRRMSSAAGALFALAKGGAVLAFILLFLHLFPVVPGLDQRIMESQIARPMVSVAGSVIRAGLRQAAEPASGGQV